MSFEFEKLEIDGVILVKPKVFGDNRGFFMETYKKSEFFQNGIEVDFYLPEEEIAIQVSYDLSDEDTYAREVTALSKFSSNYPCMEQWIITRDQYTSKQKQDPSIKVIPLCQFLLSMDHSTSNH